MAKAKRKAKSKTAQGRPVPVSSKRMLAMSADLESVLSEHRDQRAIGKDLPTGKADVIFRCDNDRCLVGISVASLQFTFVSSLGTRLPIGTHLMGWKVKSAPSGEQFKVTVEQATLSDPIQGTTGSTSGGLRDLTVPNP